MRWDWRKIAITLAVLLSAAVPTTLAVLAINLANGNQMAVELEQNGKATTYANRANIEKQRRCEPLSEELRAECEAKEDETARQAAHDEYDLAAQQSTAIWTRYMGAAAILGTAFGIFGIALVLLTFWENKRAADAAHDANRPWIEAEEPSDLELQVSLEGLKLTGDVGYINHGNSPATNVLVQACFAIKPMTDEKAETIPLSGIENALREYELRHKNRGKIVYPNKPTKGLFVAELPIAEIKAAEGEPPADCFYLLVVGISYRFGSKRGRTVTAYALTLSGQLRFVAAPFYVPKNTTEIIRDPQIDLNDTLEGYAV